MSWGVPGGGTHHFHPCPCPNPATCSSPATRELGKGGILMSMNPLRCSLERSGMGGGGGRDVLTLRLAGEMGQEAWRGQTESCFPSLTQRLELRQTPAFCKPGGQALETAFSPVSLEGARCSQIPVSFVLRAPEAGRGDCFIPGSYL